MRRRRKQLLSALLTLCLLFSLLPASALASAADSADGAATADDTSGTSYTETSVSYSTYSWDSSYTGTNYGTMTGYYYKSGETYYQVYYIYSTESDNSGQTNNVITLYYYANGTYTALTTKLYMAGPYSSNSVTLYYNSSSGDSDDDDDDDGSDDPSDTYNSNAELAAAAYRSDALVYWDIDHGGTDTNDDNDVDKYDSQHSSDENTAYITSVTLGSTTTTDDDGNETETANSVTMYDTTDEDFGSADTDFSWDSSTAGTETVSLDDVYDTKDGYGNEADTATLTITPATGYYVTGVTIVCSAYVGEGSGDPQSDSFTVTYKRISPYSCSTYKNDQAYDGSFNLSNAGGTASALTLSVDIASLYFSHDGYTLSQATDGGGNYLYYSVDSSGTVNYNETTTTETAYPVYANDGVQAVYFILIEVEEIPTPAYVEYDFGDIVTYITDELGENSSNYSAFSTASGWTDASTSNVYSDIDGGDTSTSYANTVTGTGGAMTEDTQFEYVYDDTEDEDDSTDGGSTDDGSTNGGSSDGNTDGGDSDSGEGTDSGGDTGGGGTGGDTFDTAAASEEDADAVSDSEDNDDSESVETSGDASDEAESSGGDAEADDSNDGTTEDSETGEDSSSTGYSSWKHYANSIANDAVSQAAAAGYVFAGWAVTYYTSAEVAADSSGNYTTSTTNYNKYSITFSTDSGTSTITTMVGEGDEVTVAGHVRLVAQWIRIDSSQVIDYGLPVAVDVETALLDDADIYAIVGNVTSRTSVTADYSTATTKDLEVSANVSITTDSNSTTTATGDYGTITIGSTSSKDGTSTADDSDKTSATYTLDKALEDVEDFDYTVKLTYGTSTTLVSDQAGTLYIIPATSMYYEESFGAKIGTYTYSTGSVSNTVLTNGNLISYSMNAAFWVLKGDIGTTAQETGIVGTKDDSTYGADTYYLSGDNLGDSNGSSMYVDTSSYAASFSYTFTGTGNAIYTRTLDDSMVEGDSENESTASGDEEAESKTQEGAYIRVIIWEGETEGTISSSDSDTTTTAEESSTGTVEAVGTWFIDTRIVDNVSDSSTLYNIPVFSYSDLEYGTYTVSVLVYKEGAPVQATYTTSSTDSSGNKLTQLQETETDDNDTSTTTYWYYQTNQSGEVLYYTVDDDGNSTEGTNNENTSTNETDYPVYYTSTSSGLTTATVDGSTIYLTAVYVLADDTAGGDFYLDGIRIYNPLGTEDNNISSNDSDNESSTNSNGKGAEVAEEDETENEESTETSSSELTSWDIASAAYKEDDEANNVVINIAQKLAADAEEGYTGSDSFITLTDYYGDISGYDPDDTADYPDNEIYLDSSSSTTDKEGNTSTTTYSVSFYLAVDSTQDTLDNYDVYLGLKAPDGTAGSVKINETTVKVNSSADCYYLLDSYLSSTPETITLKDESGNTTETLYGYKITITGDSGLIALTYIKVTGSDEFDIAYSSDVETENEYSEGENNGSTDSNGGTDSDDGTGDSGTETTAVSTLYLLSAASVEAEEDDGAADEDMLDDDNMAVDPDDSDSDSDTDSKSDDTENGNGSSLFEPETFTASITYLKLLRCASITVKTSTDVGYITVNGEQVAGRSSGLGKTLTFSYTASKVSSGTEFEIIAYNSNGTASEPITLTAK